MRVIFLDVDGVLNSRPQINLFKEKRENDKDINYKLHDGYLKNLSRLYHKYDDTVLVLSSSWKEKHGEEKEMVKKRLTDYDINIYDETPNYCTRTGEFCTDRPSEIHEWLNAHMGVTAWVSLDDDYNEEAYNNVNPYYGFHLCQTYFGNENDDINDCGFNRFKLHVALEILGGHLN